MTDPTIATDQGLFVEFTVTTHSFYQQFTVTDDPTPGCLLIVATAADGASNEAVPDSAPVTVVTN